MSWILERMKRWRLLELVGLGLELKRGEGGLAKLSLLEPHPESDKATEGSQLRRVQLHAEFSCFLSGINVDPD